MNQQILATGDIIELMTYDVQVAPGKIKQFEKARRAPGVRVIITKITGELLLQKEFRYELNDYDYRLPGGKVFDRIADYKAFLATGEDITPVVLETAIQEAHQEAGIHITQAQFLTKKVCGATMERDLYYVEATQRALAHDLGHRDEGEDHAIDDHQRYTPTQVRVMLQQGEIQEGRTVAVLLQYLAGKGATT